MSSLVRVTHKKKKKTGSLSVSTAAPAASGEKRPGGPGWTAVWTQTPTCRARFTLAGEEAELRSARFGAQSKQGFLASLSCCTFRSRARRKGAEEAAPPSAPQARSHARPCRECASGATGRPFAAGTGAFHARIAIGAGRRGVCPPRTSAPKSRRPRPPEESGGRASASSRCTCGCVCLPQCPPLSRADRGRQDRQLDPVRGAPGTPSPTAPEARPGQGGGEEGPAGDKAAPGKPTGRLEMPLGWAGEPSHRPPPWGAGLLFLRVTTRPATPRLGASLSHPFRCPWRQPGGRAGYEEANTHLLPRSVSSSEDICQGPSPPPRR